VPNFRVLYRCFGPDDNDEFLVEVHHNGFLNGHGQHRVYLDGKVDWFDNIKVQYWSLNAVQELSVLLGYDVGVPVWWLLPKQDMSIELRLIASEKEAQIMMQVAFKVKNYVLYLDHYHTVEGNWEDVFNPIFELPKVISPSKEPTSARTMC
jgi:hypothetical protein